LVLEPFPVVNRPIQIIVDASALSHHFPHILRAIVIVKLIYI
jgi:hypothetical protein